MTKRLVQTCHLAQVARGGIFCLLSLLFITSVITSQIRSANASESANAGWATLNVGESYHYTVMYRDEQVGHREIKRQSTNTWIFKANGRPSGFNRLSEVTLGDDGMPVALQINGQKNPVEAWQEHFTFKNSVARWKTSVDAGEQKLSEPAMYIPIHPAYDLGLLALRLIESDNGYLDLLPQGKAHIEALSEKIVKRGKDSRTLRLYAIHGLHVRPMYVWLDQHGMTFADEWAILQGWESDYPQFRAAIDSALNQHMQKLALQAMPAPTAGVLVIRNVSLFDPINGVINDKLSVLVRENRIVSVGPRSTIDIPANAQVIDADGLTMLPGLWDMHAHQDSQRFRNAYVPFHLAAGVTSTRDLGSDPKLLVAVKKQIENRKLIGPRILMAGMVDAKEGRLTGLRVGDETAAEAAVDNLANQGFVQVKIYAELPPNLVSVVIARAKEKGLRISGHIPEYMSGTDVIHAGYDEIQHMSELMDGILLSSEDEVEVSDEIWGKMLSQLTPQSKIVNDYIALMKAENVAVDPTIALFDSTGHTPPSWIIDELHRFPKGNAQRRWLGVSKGNWAGASWPQIRQHAFAILLAMHKAGVTILPGTDHFPGFGLHKELELYVEAGIPEAEVLRLATLGAARTMGLDNEFGSVEPGKYADFILIDGDPLNDIQAIRRVVWVIKDGEVYNPALILAAQGVAPCCTD
ncbi:hypothetical protein FE810_06745 [Thalassotalea litorea]|uniref:Amidohydrolase-related domain-containing protein n=1 Tax=Thalassotalea litorea TaxID=2020715 RepID=A0A5R9IM83_9GAMM|nr:amidohydrolase family protein [Thalassotalea litorea]TLU66382.1 hypothetical protein FE810_06745 [Thalassotalea litorea]